MKTIKAIPRTLFKKISPLYRVIMCIVVLMATAILFADPPPPFSVRVMKMGLGSGTITTTGIACGGDCDETFAASTSLTFTAIPDAGSTFSHWEGDISGSANPAPPVAASSDISVRAVFNLTTSIPTLTDFTPGGIQSFLTVNPAMNNAARFVAALPSEFRQNWILMSRSESLQTGTAETPRLLLPSANAQIVFSIGLATNGSYPGSHPNAIEMMQWDAAEKNFRFHEIVLNSIIAMPPIGPRSRGVSIDDSKCSKCHSTRNVLNNSPFPGTTGIPVGLVKYKNKPNWDTYDSWAGMLPFNRDRIYQGSAEAAAFRKFFNLWTWRSNESIRSVIEQLELQPSGVPSAHVITRTEGGPNDGHINFVFDGGLVVTEPTPLGTDAPITTNYLFTALAGSGTMTSVARGGAFLTLHHSGIPSSDEGRGVHFFDLLNGFYGSPNQQRIADELINHRYATGSIPIDVRPLVLAISAGLLSRDAATNTVVSTEPGAPLTIDLSFFTARNGMSINDLFEDTRSRAYNLTRRKADLQKLNLDRTSDIYLRSTSTDNGNGLIQQYGSATASGTDNSMSRLRQEVFRRPIGPGFNDRTIMGGIYVDREIEQNTEQVALFRYFLEPLGVSVDKWSMGVRGRSRTYTFADIFGSYTDFFAAQMKASLTSEPVGGIANPNNDAQVIAGVNNTLSSLPGINDVPTYTDVQRIFNKSCIECHGGLEYPPYVNFGSSFLDFSEDENPPGGTPPGVSPRLARSYAKAINRTNGGLTSPIYDRLNRTNEDCNNTSVQLMPCGGPALSKTDIETVRRWIDGGRPSTNGDPHLKTINGVYYDFQAAGEFVLLRGEGLELQARHTAVKTNAPLGPNAHTGLTTCVSVTGAIAMRVGEHRITYQPNLSGEPDSSGLQLRVDGKLVQLSPQGIPLTPGGRIMQTAAPGGIQVEAQGGTVIVITPGWWEQFNLWYLHVDTRHVRATQGLMGYIAPGEWLPALPDGSLMSPKPGDLNKRYAALYKKLGNAWRVNDSTSLFDYAPGTSTKNFTIANWPGGESAQSCETPNQPLIKALQPIARAVAERLATGITDSGRRANCIMDIMITGEPGFAKTYLWADKVMRNSPPEPPKLIAPNDFATGLVSPVSFEWNKTTDKDGDSITYKLLVWEVNEASDNNKAIAVASNTGWRQSSDNNAAMFGLAGVLLFAILYFSGLRKLRGLSVLVAVVILAGVVVIYSSCGKRYTTSKMSLRLTSVKAYFWKVIAEDGKGGTAESEMRRFEVK